MISITIDGKKVSVIDIIHEKQAMDRKKIPIYTENTNGANMMSRSVGTRYNIEIIKKIYRLHGLELFTYQDLRRGCPEIDKSYFTRMSKNNTILKSINYSGCCKKWRLNPNVIPLLERKI